MEEDFTVQYLQTLHQKSIDLARYCVNLGHKNPDLPPVRNPEGAEGSIHRILDGKSGWTEKALNLMLYLVKQQLFYDGNKRIAMMAANKALISHGCGVLTVAQDQQERFFELLEAYDEDESKKEELKLFLYDKCLDGFRKSIS